MATNNVNLNVRVNPSLDRAGLRKALEQAFAAASADGIDIDINIEDAEQELLSVAEQFEQLEELMQQALDVDVNTEEGEAALARLEDALQNIENTALDEIDTGGLAAEFERAQKELAALEDTQRKALAQMKLAGQESTDAYKKLTAELGETRDALDEMAEAADDVSKKDPGSFLERFAKFEAIGQAGEALGAFAEKGAGVRKAMSDLQLATNLTGDELEQARAQAEDLFRAKGAEDLQQAIEKTSVALKLLKNTLPQNEIAEFAANSAKLFGDEFNDKIGRSRTFIAQFGLDGKRAFDLIALGEHDTASVSGDFLETLDEYSQLVAQAGFSAERFVGVLTTGIAAGTRDTDKLADAIKETQIRLKAGDTAGAVAAISSPITAQIQGLTTLAETGQLSIADFMQQAAESVETAFASGQISESIRTQFQVAISGTMAEDIGSNLYGKIFSAKIDEQAVRERATQAGDAIKNALPPTFGERITAELEIAASNLGEVFAPFLAGASGAADAFGQFAPALSLLDDKFKIFDKAGGLFDGLGPKLLGLIPGFATVGATGQASFLGIQLSATAAWAAATLGIAAVVAGIIYLLTQTKAGQEILDSIGNGFSTLTTYVSSFASNAGEIIAALYEYAKAKLNPAAWFGEDTEAEEAASKRLTAVISKSIKGAQQEIAKSKLGTAVEEAVAIKGDLDKNGQLKKLVSDFKSAKTEAEKNSLAEAIQQQVPGALNGIKTIVDENGKLQTVYDINVEKAEEFAAAQEKSLSGELLSKTEVFRQGIASLGDEFDSNRKKQIKLQQAIVEGAGRGEDVSELREQYAELETEIQKSAEALTTTVTQGKELGVITSEGEDIAKSLGFAGEKADVLNGAIAKAATETKKGATAAKDWGKQFDSAKAQAEALRNTLAGQVNGLTLELKNSKASTEEREELRKKLQETTKLYKQAATEVDKINTTEANTNYIATTAADRLQKKLDKQLTEIDQQKTIRDTMREINLIQRGTESTILDEIDAQQDVIKTLKEKQSVVEATAKRTPDLQQREELRAQAAELQRQIDLENLNLEKLVVQTRLDTGGLDKRLGELQRDYRQKQIELNISLGLTTEQDLVELFEEDLGKLQQQRAGIEAKLEPIRFQILTETDPIKLKLLQQQERELQIQLQEFAGQEFEIQQSRTGALAALRQRQYDKEKAALDKEAELLDRRLGREQEFWDDLLSMREQATADAAEALQSTILDNIDREEQDALERAGLVEQEALTAQEEAKLAIQEKYAAKRAAIEEEFRKQQIISEQRLAGERLALQQTEDLQRLEQQRRALEAEKKFAEERGDAVAAAQIAAQLDGVAQQITEKSDLILTLSGQLQAGLSDTFENLFAGNDEGAKDSMRKTLSVIAGYLQKLATSAVVEIVLASAPIKALAAAAGFGAPLVLAGATALISQIVNAITTPIVSNLLSFSTGGRVDGPTMAIVGDGAKLGGNNREWILRDDQLKAVVNDALSRSGAQTLAALGEIKQAIGQERVVGMIKGSDILLVVQRAKYEDDKRVRGKTS